MIKVSCVGKLHSFNLSEQLVKHEMLSTMYTSYAHQKNWFFRNFVNRLDKENIPKALIKTNILIAILQKLIRNNFIINELFDYWVMIQLKLDNNYSILIAWSGMSLNSLRYAKKKGKIVILERGSTHIIFQNRILKEEYKKHNIDFEIDPRVIKKEISEYLEADFISIPSSFVKQTFINEGINENKLIINPYGASSFFKKINIPLQKKIFRILYLGVISIRKGFDYFYEAIKTVDIEIENFEVWVIGTVTEEMKNKIDKIKEKNIFFLGHINHYDLPKYISECDIAIQPSVEEGLSMVVLQLLSCGVPVIASYNTGASDLIVDNYNGFVVPCMSSISIKNKIEVLFNDQNLLRDMQLNAETSVKNGFTWEDYGNRYINFISSIS
jgi:glycosyltransferase involved in cell wall biosynthesis